MRKRINWDTVRGRRLASKRPYKAPYEGSMSSKRDGLWTEFDWRYYCEYCHNHISEDEWDEHRGRHLREIYGTYRFKKKRKRFTP